MLRSNFYFLASTYAVINESDLISQKRDCKRNLVCFGSCAGGKIVLILLAKVVAFYVGYIVVDVRGHGLEFVFRFTFGGIEECLDDFV